MTDLSFLTRIPISPVFIKGKFCSWVIDKSIIDISNGYWLLGVDGKFDVYNIALMPGRKITVTNKDFDFTCRVDEVEIMGKVIVKIESI